MPITLWVAGVVGEQRMETPWQRFNTVWQLPKWSLTVSLPPSLSFSLVLTTCRLVNIEVRSLAVRQLRAKWTTVPSAELPHPVFFVAGKGTGDFSLLFLGKICSPFVYFVF